MRSRLRRTSTAGLGKTRETHRSLSTPTSLESEDAARARSSTHPIPHGASFEGNSGQIDEMILTANTPFGVLEAARRLARNASPFAVPCGGSSKRLCALGWTSQVIHSRQTPIKPVLRMSDAVHELPDLGVVNTTIEADGSPSKRMAASVGVLIGSVNLLHPDAAQATRCAAPQHRSRRIRVVRALRRTQQRTQRHRQVAGEIHPRDASQQKW